MAGKGEPLRGRIWRWMSAVVAALIGLVVFVNEVPQLVDQTLPWIGNHVRVGPFEPTVWQFIGLMAVVAGLGWLATLWLTGRTEDSIGLTRSKRASIPGGAARSHADAGGAAGEAAHTISGIGRDWLRCSCGWTGSRPDFMRHKAGDPVASTNVPMEPPRVPDQAEVVALASEAWDRLMTDGDLTPDSRDADARLRGLRLWLDRWEIAVETALTGDEATQAVFSRPVDTSQMNEFQAPVHALRTRLQRLTSYTSGTPLAVEMRLDETFNRVTDHPVGGRETPRALDARSAEISANDAVRQFVALWDEGSHLSRRIQGGDLAQGHTSAVDRAERDWLERCRTLIEQERPAFILRFRQSLVPPPRERRAVERPNLLDPSVMHKDFVRAPEPRLRVIEQVRGVLRDIVDGSH